MSLPSPSIASSDATLVPSSSALVNGHMLNGGNGETINVQIYVPEYNVQKCLNAKLDDSVWEIKQQILALLPKDMQEGFNYGLFLPPCNGRAGKFLLEDRPLRDYPFQDCVPYLELKYKKRVYKLLNLDEKMLKQLHTKAILKKFLDYVEERQSDKVEKLCQQGLDPNFHDGSGETPLTIAASVDDNRSVILALTSGGAHLDFRNLEGQTALHKSAFLSTHSNVKTLLELGASPNYRDPLGLTPLYYCMLKMNTNPNTAELLLRDYAEIGVMDPHGNHELHQACKNGLVAHMEHLLFYGAEINSRNVNGNTPLHVCAVNNQEACARVLLFRGADPAVVNNQGQTAFHVAVITGHHGVAELIRTHDANSAVPYRGMPRYNSKRRLARRSPASGASDVSSIGRSKSSVSECPYGTLRGTAPRNFAVRSLSQNTSANVTPASSALPSPAIIRQPISTIQPSQQQYGMPTTTICNNMPLAGHSSVYYPSLAMTVSGNQTMPPDCRPAILQMIKKSVSEQNALAAAGHLATIRGIQTGNPIAPIQRISPETAAQLGGPVAAMNIDVNIPRTLVIPRGPKGFGFILRGAKKVDAAVNFEPTPEIPALQYFEGVDMNGMAMKAGLKPGDFLLEINGNDVRCASHDQVVQLIQLSGETISLKVITIDPNEPIPAAPYYGTYRRNSKPAPPIRHAATSLSIAAGRSLAGLMPHDDCIVGGSIPYHGYQPMRSAMYPNATVAAKSIDHVPITYRDSKDKVASIRGRVNSRRISAAELEQLMARQHVGGNGNCMSNVSFSSDSEPPGTPSSYRSGNGAPKVYNSVAEMKRQKLYRMQQQQARENVMVVHNANVMDRSGSSGNLKSFHSSPDLQASELALAHERADDRHSEMYSDDTHYNNRALMEGEGNYGTNRRQSRPSERTYGVPTKCILRPKTPPPAPPINRSATVGRSGTSTTNGMGGDSITYGQGLSSNGLPVQYQSQQPHIPEPDYDDPPIVDRPVSNSAGSKIPPPPPPPPPVSVQPVCNDFKTALAMKKQQIMNKSGSDQSKEAPSVSCDSSKPRGTVDQAAASGKVDFTSDLRNAIARRRTQLDKQTGKESSANGNEATKSSVDAKSSGMVGMSLKESVQKNIQTNSNIGGRKPIETNGSHMKTTKPPGAVGNTSPPVPNGFSHKKDSGFSSSRNSLEPNDGEETVSAAGNGDGQDIPVISNEDTLKQHRVSFLSNQLEDNLGNTHLRNQSSSYIAKSASQQQGRSTMTRQRSITDQQDAISLASTLSTLSGCSDATGSSSLSHHMQQHRSRRDESIPPMPDGPPPVPPPDYEAADSGTGDSENDDVTPTLSQQNLAHQSNTFRHKPLISWTVADVCDWLDSLYLSEYKRGFSRANVDGRLLLHCDRTQFTKLGVTRIAHRIPMENSLKQYKNDGNRSAVV